MKERPILFSGDMVRAILDGRKTQTRRLVTPQPQPSQRFVGLRSHLNYPASEGETWAGFDHKANDDINPVYFRCPYGAPGDRLWVRETWAAFSASDYWSGECDLLTCSPSKMPDRYGTDRSDVVYAADGTSHPDRWRPSIHMPRWASRLTLEVVSVRVERLQDITEADARAEGVDCGAPWFPPGQRSPPDEDPRQVGYGRGNFALQNFRTLWEHINGKRAPGQSNPWVWVVTFKPL